MNDKIQDKIPASISVDNKNINFDLEALVKLQRDYPSNYMTGYPNVNSIRNKIVHLADICKHLQ